MSKNLLESSDIGTTLNGSSEKIEALHIELWLLESWHLELVAPVGHWCLWNTLWLHHLHHFEQWVRLGGSWLVLVSKMR